MRLSIDWTACQGRGICAELLPEVLTQDPWGYPMARAGHGPVEIPDALEPHARRAVHLCPVLALRLEETSKAH